MIEVHLRAATKRPPSLEAFEDEKRWLLCALNDDQTNERVQAAVHARFLAHVSQLADAGTPESHSAAISVLVGLRTLLPLNGQAEDWLRILKDSTPGAVKLAGGGERK
jgi:hypothetical protein